MKINPLRSRGCVHTGPDLFYPPDRDEQLFEVAPGTRFQRTFGRRWPNWYPRTYGTYGMAWVYDDRQFWTNAPHPNGSSGVLEQLEVIESAKKARKPQKAKKDKSENKEQSKTKPKKNGKKKNPKKKERERNLPVMMITPRKFALITRKTMAPTGHTIQWTVGSSEQQKGEVRIPRNWMPWYRVK